jgi:hypothetical protein
MKMFEAGHPEIVNILSSVQVLTLCCASGTKKSDYYFYSEDDPCCFYEVLVDCEKAQPRPSGSTGGGTVPSSLRIQPNPTSSAFRISSDAGSEFYESVIIKDMTGKVLISKTNIDSKTDIDVSKFSKGSYFVTVKTKMGSSTTLKLVTIND